MKYTIDAAKAASKAVVANSSLDLASGACLISVEIQGACGERTLSESKSLIDGEVLDSDMVSGTKLRWFPKSSLQFTNSLSKKVSRELRKFGVSFSKGATMVPIAQLGELAAELESIEMEFSDEVNTLRQQYDEILAEHKAKNPDVAHLIERCVEPVDKFTGRFTFKVNPPMAIQPLFDEDQQTMAKSAAETLLDEIAIDAAKIYKNSISGAEKAGEAKMRGIVALKNKLLNLSFIDPSIARVALAFEDLFSKLPKTYPIEGGDFQMVAHFIAAASDPEKLRNFGMPADDDAVQDDVEVDSADTTKPENIESAPADADVVVEENEESDEETTVSESVEETQSEPELVEEAPVSAEPVSGAFNFDGW
jgi:hypothetical protein